MGTSKTPIQIVLTRDERATLERIIRSTTAPHGAVVRAKLVVLVADGTTLSSVARQVGLRRRIVHKWATRFVKLRLAGLEDRPRSGRPARFSPRSRLGVGEAGLRAA